LFGGLKKSSQICQTKELEKMNLVIKNMCCMMSETSAEYTIV